MVDLCSFEWDFRFQGGIMRSVSRFYVLFLCAFAIVSAAKADTDGYTYKAMLMTGDDSINTFDNARHKIKTLLEGRGVESNNIRMLSVNPDEAIGETLPTTLENMTTSLDKLGVRSSDACLVHMTSHGSHDGFFYIKPNTKLTPAILNKMLEQTCGDQPTVVMVSACYSGVFAEGEMQKPNRVILTAARNDRPSFGCSPGETYTYWDGCLIQELPGATSWKGLYDSISSCVTKKEDELMEKDRAKFGRTRLKPSFPQFYQGAAVTNLPMPASNR